MARNRNVPAIWAFIAGMGVMAIVFFVVYGATPWGQQDENVPSNRVEASAPSIGDPDAPITVIEYADFQCVYCQLFAREIKPQLEEEFIDTGIMRIEWRHFPIFGEASDQAAYASACAHEQDAFWEYHDALFDARESLGSASSLDAYVDMAETLGLDTEQFQACMEEDRYAETIAANFQEGRLVGVTGTPAFLINGRLLVGAHPIETWREALEVVAPELFDQDDASGVE